MQSLTSLYLLRDILDCIITEADCAYIHTQLDKQPNLSVTKCYYENEVSYQMM